MDHSKAQDPGRMAQLELSAAYGCNGEDQPYHLTRAQVFATLAVADAITEQTKWIREVADQLDARPVQVVLDSKQLARAVDQGNKAMHKDGAA